MKKEPKDQLPVHSCPGHIQIPTEKEQEALEAMRKIKEQVREKKALLKEMRVSQTVENEQRILWLESELKVLKGQWDQWKKKREEAARERMILLGHEEPDKEGLE
ncbi:MAG: hypothetical protein JRH08_01930 [Deltaproteobacteria bacterium]|nr:hypothetical protein [Deltaproteobacteria bacterium]MBW1928279.1 hypothetical protein [Deltaproteobacteria bacterium]MBW2025049.1 hypothetical protein [Deltaproteobacteria bacterium]MBW2124458.1 hypothetical protein [Deltaproteobacteria bacterium]RLB23079.1 MAG: hypothetical protein DRG76_05125 [Deltaproteobacteria bacterium]